ncbi:acyltransferase family protein [Fibrella aquatilis]|uniref:Acyltransferase n=1 Tax=Fibrella aquatilis TaxID=2817059 RepID=A0A939G8L7_9BACT|nr:acyltransferase [Fibrella aquatilis]MBO0932639.1 acyltransferase [Fibrella aquatilis]
MGLLRVLLAAAVVFVHAGPLRGFHTLGGNLAVQAFYMISGFYMALILNEKYVPSASLSMGQTYRLFLTNRLLRLFPIYYATLLIIGVVAIVMWLTLGEVHLEFAQAVRAYGHQLSTGTKAFLVVVNALLVGQDWVSFLTLAPTTHALIFTRDFSSAPVNLNNFLLVHQGWTIGLEITFYLMAPFLVRRKSWVLILVVVLATALRVYLRRQYGLTGLAWQYRFFPTEIAFFMLGALGYKAYRVLRQKSIPLAVRRLCLYGALGFTLFFGEIFQITNRLGVPPIAMSTLFTLTIAACIPVLFIHSKTNRLDQRIGDLSYPLYIVHYIVFEALRAYGLGGNYQNLLTLALSLGLAVGLNQLVGEPVEALRRRVALRLH